MKGGRHLVGALVLALVVVGATSPVAVASDGAVIVSVEPDEVAADPGETVTVDVVVSDHGDLYGNGLVAVDLTVEWDGPLELADLEHRPWLASGDGEADHEVSVDAANGTATITEQLATEGDGVRGSEPIATLELTVPADAAPATASVTTASELVRAAEYPPHVVERSGTVLVDGGGESGDDREDPDGITLGEDARPGDGDSAGGDPAGEPGDATPGPGALVALLAVAAALALRR